MGCNKARVSPSTAAFWPQAGQAQNTDTWGPVPGEVLGTHAPELLAGMAVLEVRAVSRLASTKAGSEGLSRSPEGP